MYWCHFFQKDILAYIVSFPVCQLDGFTARVSHVIRVVSDQRRCRWKVEIWQKKIKLGTISTVYGQCALSERTPKNSFVAFFFKISM